MALSKTDTLLQGLLAAAPAGYGCSEEAPFLFVGPWSLAPHAASDLVDTSLKHLQVKNCCARRSWSHV